jgi:hypothetical protein
MLEEPENMREYQAEFGRFGERRPATINEPKMQPKNSIKTYILQ